MTGRGSGGRSKCSGCRPMSCDIEPLQKGELVAALHGGHWHVFKINKYLPRSNGYKAHPYSRLRGKFAGSNLIDADKIQTTISEDDVRFFDHALNEINQERDQRLHEIDRLARIKACHLCAKLGLDGEQVS